MSSFDLFLAVTFRADTFDPLLGSLAWFFSLQCLGAEDFLSDSCRLLLPLACCRIRSEQLNRSHLFVHRCSRGGCCLMSSGDRSRFRLLGMTVRRLRDRSRARLSCRRRVRLRARLSVWMTCRSRGRLRVRLSVWITCRSRGRLRARLSVWITCRSRGCVPVVRRSGGCSSSSRCRFNRLPSLPRRRSDMSRGLMVACAPVVVLEGRPRSVFLPLGGQRGKALDGRRGQRSGGWRLCDCRPLRGRRSWGRMSRCWHRRGLEGLRGAVLGLHCRGRR